MLCKSLSEQRVKQFKDNARKLEVCACSLFPTSQMLLSPNRCHFPFINEDPFWNHTLGPRSDLCFFWPMTACQKKSFIIGSPCTQMLHFAPFSLNYVKSLFSLGLSH